MKIIAKITTFLCLIAVQPSLAEVTFTTCGTSCPTKAARGVWLTGKDAETLFNHLQVAVKASPLSETPTKWLELSRSADHQSYLVCTQVGDLKQTECYLETLELK